MCDLRYGGLLIRIDTTIYELKTYLNGEFDRLKESEYERLLYDGIEGVIHYVNHWEKSISLLKIVTNIWRSL